MKIKQEELLINNADPFLNCKLDRKKYAEILTNIVSTYSEGFVIAINNEWGTGKTTFVKMWQGHLENQGFHTRYFNAWENDFDSNPLVAIMAELKSLTNTGNKKLFDSLVQKGAAITKNVLPAVLKSIAMKYIQVDVITDAIENTTKAATEILEDEIKNYTSKKEGLIDFKKKLEEFVKKVEGDKPIILIIDELDRCRPNYAVEVLEQIKHFFSVKGIIFVLSIDKEQLGNAIRGVYGSEKINSEEYLRRFIDLEYNIEPPDAKLYCNYLYDYFQLGHFFENEHRLKLAEVKNDKDILITVASIAFSDSNLTLRQQEKIFAHTRLVLNSFKVNNYVFPSLLIVLIYIRSFHPDLYRLIKFKQLDYNNLLDRFVKIFPKKIHEDYVYYFTQLEAILIFMYRNSTRDNSNIKFNFFEDGEDGKEFCTIQSRFTSNNRRFEQQLRYFIENWNLSETKIEYLISKIDLIEAVIA